MAIWKIPLFCRFGVIFVNSVKINDDGKIVDFGEGNNEIENDLEDFRFYFKLSDTVLHQRIDFHQANI